MSKEEVYNEQIRPLMDMIIGVCQEHKIAMNSHFHVGDGMLVSTVLLTTEYDPTQCQVDSYMVLQAGGIKEVVKNLVFVAARNAQDAHTNPGDSLPGKPRETH